MFFFSKILRDILYIDTEMTIKIPLKYYVETESGMRLKCPCGKIFMKKHWKRHTDASSCLLKCKKFYAKYHGEELSVEELIQAALKPCLLRIESLEEKLSKFQISYASHKRHVEKKIGDHDADARRYHLQTIFTLDPDNMTDLMPMWEKWEHEALLFKSVWYSKFKKKEDHCLNRKWYYHYFEAFCKRYGGVFWKCILDREGFMHSISIDGKEHIPKKLYQQIWQRLSEISTKIYQRNYYSGDQYLLDQMQLTCLTDIDVTTNDKWPNPTTEHPIHEIGVTYIEQMMETLYDQAIHHKRVALEKTLLAEGRLDIDECQY